VLRLPGRLPARFTMGMDEETPLTDEKDSPVPKSAAGEGRFSGGASCHVQGVVTGK